MTKPPESVGPKKVIKEMHTHSLAVVVGIHMYCTQVTAAMYMS